MKIKYNIPKLNELKNKINNIGNKIKKEREEKGKIPVRYYTLFILMLAIGIISFAGNVKEYNDLNTPKYKEYKLEDNIKTDANIIEKATYETAISSISTQVSNVEESNEEAVSKKTIDGYIWPVNGYVINEHAVDNLSYSTTLDMWRIHPGVDIAAELNSEVRAVKEGIIIAVIEDSFYGNTIKIEHNDECISVYSNLANIQGVAIGDRVSQGDVIGVVGETAYGEIKEQSHLHFELLKNNEWINPNEILE